MKKLKNLIQTDKGKTPLGMIIEYVEERYSIPRESIYGKLRDRSIFRARQALCWLMKEKLNWSYSDIGRFLDKDHSTVMNCVRKFRIEEHPELKYVQGIDFGFNRPHRK